jgi:tRNA pseudouridine38-40 synthase
MTDTTSDPPDGSRNIKLTLSYDGTRYHGWQYQPNAITVQSTVQEAVEKIVDHRVKIVGGARTDAGVHAVGQVLNFRTTKTLAASNLIRGINSTLPTDIRIIDVQDVASEFHARYSAKSKVYVYCILNRLCNSPFLSRYAYNVPHVLDVVAMKDAAKIIVGEHDFSAFKKKDEFYRNPVRAVLKATAVGRRDMVYIVIEATGFLRYMVRNISGTLLLVGRGRMTRNDFQTVLESREREKAGPTAPPHGLFLKEIRY